MYELARPLDEDQPFDNWKEKSTTVIYLGISSIHASKSTLVLRFSTGSEPPQLHVVFDPYFTIINGHDGNIVLNSYW